MHPLAGQRATAARSPGQSFTERDLVRDRVVVVGNARRLQIGGLLARLASLMPLAFVETGVASSRSPGRFEAVLELGRAASPPLAEGAADLPRFTVPGTVVLDKAASLSPVDVQFAADPMVPFPFRGRRVTTQLARLPAPLTLGPFERALATGPAGVLWAVSDRAGKNHHRSAMPLLDVGDQTGFDEVFNGDRFLENLPLLNFLRTELPSCGYENAPLRAAFIFDDPNLHWPKYGFIDFRAMAERARQQNFHVAFATIPLDAWYSHKQAVDIFRDNPAQLSLLVHGNNHSKRELAQAVGRNEAAGLAQQALSRIERLEARSGLAVCRVMVPPHGACSDTMLGCLDTAGFESACISSGSLRHHNPAKSWGSTLGFHPAELINGTPVLPRWSFEGNAENTVLVAAYLGRPMILRGHHQDLRQGYEVLDRIAGFINGLGPVAWTRLSELSRMSFRYRLESGLCRVATHGKQVRMTLPDEATHLLIEPGHGALVAADFLVRQGGMPQRVRSGARVVLAPGAGRTLEIFRIEASLPTPARVAWPATAAKVVLRRFLTESRDRLLPHAP